MRNVCHLVDDTNMGGVMTALENFNDPRVTQLASQHRMIVNPKNHISPPINAEIIVLHFTVSWSKLRFLTDLRLRNRSAKIIIVEHSYTEGFEKWNVSNRFRFRSLLILAYMLCDHVVAVSKGQAVWLQKLGLGKKLIVIPQSRNLSDLEERYRDSITDNSDAVTRPIRFGLIGRFHQQKGFDQLVTAFRSRSDKSTQLLIGGFGEEEKNLRSLAGDDPNIHFLGKIQDVSSFFQSVDIVVVPSLWEAYGLVASEAMAAGKFVIVSDVDGLPEQVETAGLVWPMQSVGSLTSKIDQISNDYSLMEIIKIGAEARETALSRYDTMIENWVNLIKSCSRPISN